MRIAPEDIAVYIYKENNAATRTDRLSEAAAHYAAWRGLSGGNFTVGQKAKGKPYFPQQPDINFSISHSGAYWLAAFHNAPLGLDAQQHKQRDYRAIAKRWYHAGEYEAVLRYGAPRFFDIWSAKESFCKVDGQGITSAFARFCVVEQDGSLAACCQGLQLCRMELAEGYSACLCAANIGRIHIVWQ